MLAQKTKTIARMSEWSKEPDLRPGGLIIAWVRTPLRAKQMTEQAKIRVK